MNKRLLEMFGKTLIERRRTLTPQRMLTNMPKNGLIYSITKENIPKIVNSVSAKTKKEIDIENGKALMGIIFTLNCSAIVFCVKYMFFYK
jgi:hypothetical protein